MFLFSLDTMSARFSSAELEKMLALARADEAKVAADPLVAKAQEELLKGQKATEKARKLLAYAQIGQTGTITDENTRLKTELLIKALATMSEFLTTTSTQVGGAWLAPSKSKMTEFLQALEVLHNSTIAAVTDLVHQFDLGNYKELKEGLDSNIACLEEASNKRKRVYDASAATVGCKCRKQCSGKCVCALTQTPCVLACRCSSAQCQNPFGCKTNQQRRPKVPSEHPLRSVVKPTHHNSSNSSDAPTEFFTG